MGEGNRRTSEKMGDVIHFSDRDGVIVLKFNLGKGGPCRFEYHITSGYGEYSIGGVAVGSCKNLA